MARSPKNRKKSLRKKRRTPRLDQSRTGMPAKDSVTGIEEIRTGRQTYRIIHTDEVDEYEKPAKP